MKKSGLERRFRIPNKDANKKPSGGASQPAPVASQTGAGDSRMVSPSSNESVQGS